MKPAGKKWKWPTHMNVIYYFRKKMLLKNQDTNYFFVANYRCHYKFKSKFCDDVKSRHY